MTRREAARAEPSNPPRYVPQLDGLRAIAVLMVVLFHLGLGPFRSGFLGVDIFFVISGFLITSLLIAESKRTGRISLPAFWARRARRLLPALALMLLAVALVGRMSATFSERRSLRIDLLSAIGYVANWHFINTSSYFASTGVPSPVEHTWSLAIEEQFYLVWPLLVVGLSFVFVRLIRAIGAVAVAGILASTVLLALLWVPDAVERAYMGTDAKIFEPLIGALGAILVTGAWVSVHLRQHGSMIGIIGALGMLAVIVVIGPAGPGYYDGGALLLCAMTLLVLMSVWMDTDGPLSRTLRVRPLVWIGVISYGVYLWHWPVTLWLRARDPYASFLPARRMLAIAITIGIAAVSYYGVENRIRKGSAPGKHAPVSFLAHDRDVLVGVPLVLLTVACVSIAATRVPPLSKNDFVVMMVGDSVPRQLADSLEEATRGVGWRIENAAIGGCPATGEEPVNRVGERWRLFKPCPPVVPQQDEMLAETHPDIVVWWDRASISNFESFDGELVIAGTPRFWQLRGAALDAAVRRFSADGAFVLFVATEPAGSRLNEAAWPRFEIQHYFDITTKWNAMMQRYAEEHPQLAAYVSITDAVCHTPITSPCDDTIDGVSARSDGHHYDGPGATLAVDTLLARMAPIVRRLGGRVPQ